MSLNRCSEDGYRWGEQGTHFTGPEAKAEALKQGIAIEGPEKFRQTAAEQLDIADLDLIIEVAYLAGMAIAELDAIKRDMKLEWDANADFIYEDRKTGERFRFRRRSPKKKEGRTLRFIGKAD